ncbi:hypothetical protein D9M71_759040 [compost metagenome]
MAANASRSPRALAESFALPESNVTSAASSCSYVPNSSMRLFIAPTSSVVGAMPAWICRVVRRSSERKLISRAASASPAALPSTVTGRPAASTLASVFSWMTLVSPLVFL